MAEQLGHPLPSRLHRGRIAAWRYSLPLAAILAATGLDSFTSRAAAPASTSPRSSQSSADSRWLAENYVVSRISTAQGLAQNTVNAIAQTPDGYLWFGTLFGLCRYDGNRITIYDKTNCPALEADDTCESLAVTTDGHLWMGTFEGLVQITPQGEFRKWRKPPNLPTNRVSRLVADTVKGLWLRTGGVISHWHDGHLRTYPPPRSFSNDTYSIGAITAHPNGGCIGIWRAKHDGTSHTGIAHFQPENAEPTLSQPSGFPDDHLNRILFQPDQSLLLGGRQGLFVVENQACRKISPIQYPTEDQINFISHLWHLDDGQIWYTQSNTRLLRSDGLGARALTLPHIAGGFTVNAHLKDREGNHWLGTDRVGLIKLRPRSFQTVGIEQGMEPDFVYTVTEGPDHSILAGTRDGYYQWDSDRRLTHHSPDNQAMRTDRVITLMANPDGLLWIGGATGLELIQGGQTYNYEGDVGYPDFNRDSGKEGVLSLYRDTGGRTWIGTMYGALQFDSNSQRVELVNRIPGEEGNYRLPGLRRVLAPEGEGELRVLCFQETSDGAIWIGTNKQGVFRQTAESVTNYTTRDGLPVNHGWCFHEDRSHTLWLGTEEGLCFLSDHQFHTITTADGLDENVINSLLSDDHGNLWIGGLKGIYRIPQTELTRFVRGEIDQLNPIHYNELDGLASSETNGERQPTAYKLSDGRLCFATVRGVAIVDPNTALKNDLPPLPVIEKVRVNGTVAHSAYQSNQFHRGLLPLLDDSQLRIHDFPPGSGELIEFEFTANTFLSNQRLKFDYMLAGHDETPIKAGHRRHVSYTNLKPGTYAFKLRACNSHGVWSEFAAIPPFQFRIHPFYHQTRWFWALLTLAIGLAVWTAHRYRLHIRLRQEQLGHDIEQLQARIRFSRDMHDDLGAGLSRISLLCESMDANAADSERQGGINKVATEARRLSEALSEIIWMNNPKNDALDHVISYLRRTVAEHLDEAGIALHYTGPTDIPPLLLKHADRRNLYLIIKEAYTNIIRHSAAENAYVTLQINAKQLWIRIEDDGVGRDSQTSKPGHYGLENMATRAQDLGGRLEITNRSRCGTRIELTIPRTDK